MQLVKYSWSLNPSHLVALSLSEDSCHHGVQLSELTQRGADVSVKVFVFLILVTENCFVLLPFFHRTDLWILPTERSGITWGQQQTIKYIWRVWKIEFNVHRMYIVALNVHSHDVVCDDECFGSRRVSLQTDWVLVDLRDTCTWTDMVFILRFIHFILERYPFCFGSGQWDGLVKLLLTLKVKEKEHEAENSKPTNE